MTITITPSPIRKSLRVECNPKRAFEVFTGRELIPGRRRDAWEAGG